VPLDNEFRREERPWQTTGQRNKTVSTTDRALRGLMKSATAIPDKSETGSRGSTHDRACIPKGGRGESQKGAALQSLLKKTEKEMRPEQSSPGRPDYLHGKNLRSSKGDVLYQIQLEERWGLTGSYL